jgi:uncharacterized protein (TIGR00251 family)
LEDQLELTVQRDGVFLTLWVQPRSGRDEVVGVRAGMLRVRVAAPPAGGAANEALVRLLAHLLRVARSDVEVVQGHRSRRKRIKVYGVSAEEVRALLAEAMQS